LSIGRWLDIRGSEPAEPSPSIPAALSEDGEADRSETGQGGPQKRVEGALEGALADTPENVSENLSERALEKAFYRGARRSSRSDFAELQSPEVSAESLQRYEAYVACVCTDGNMEEKYKQATSPAVDPSSYQMYAAYVKPSD
jgi:hypothetical protein